MAITAIIIGSGFGGLCTAIKLQENGIPFVILEQSDSIGGVWYQNNYPGCKCDVPSHVYSFSFEPNMNWDEVYNSKDAIWEYLNSVVEKYGIRKHIKFNTKVEECIWDELQHTWIVKSATQEFTSNILIPALGMLQQPQFPNVSGMEDFEGASFHSARWDKGCSLNNKRVVVVGTGASASQLVPHVAKVAKKVSVIQRTPNWYVPAQSPLHPNGYNSLWKGLFNYVPLTARFHRWYLYWTTETLYNAGLLDKQQSKRSKFEQFVKSYMKAAVQNKPELISQIIPDYPAFCKRIIRDTDFLSALTRDNVELVSGSLERVTKNGVVVNDTEYDADVIVYASGFSAGSIGDLKIKGINNAVATGKDFLNKHNHFLYGITHQNFPNMFFIYGPQTNLGHSSIVFMIECQVNYLVNVIQHMKSNKIKSMKPKESAVSKYMQWVDEEMENRIWPQNCHSWYENENGKITTMWPTGTVGYWWATRTVDFSAYDKFHSNPIAKL